MNISLPEIIQFKQVCAHESAWADHYGALYAAGNYCEVEIPQLYRFPHVWQHGCVGPWDKEPEVISFNAPDAKNKKIFVARKEDEEILKDAGYNKARAIGLPIVYIDSPPVKRNPGSLLVMPQHTLVGMKRGTEDERKAYIQQLKPHLSDFDVVFACISPSCIQNGHFVKEFQEIGVEIIPGAMTSDINALLRMRCLMEQFETMTTNGWGSHLAYALYCGMKVSVLGEYFKAPENEALKDVSWSTLPSDRMLELRKRSMNGAIEFVEPFRSIPRDGKADKELGEWLVGHANKVSPSIMRELFEW